jgi:sporulation protein YlmC with PRC-barrel domain
MKLFTRILALAVLTIALAACGGDAATEPPASPAVTQPPATLTTGPTEEIPATGPTGTTAPSSELTPLEAPAFGSELLSYELLDADGNSLGTVSGLLVDSLTGQILHVVANGGTNLGLETDLYPIPWQALHTVQVAPAERSTRPRLGFQLAVTPDRLEGAPSLAEDFLVKNPIGGEFDAAGWNGAIDAFWGEFADLPRRPEAIGVPIRVTGGLFGGIDYDINDFDAEPVGETADFIVGPDGLVRYAVLEINSFLGFDNTLIPLPWQSLSWDPSSDSFLLVVGRDVLNEAPGYRSVADFPDITAPDWDADLLGYWDGRLPTEAVTRANLAPDTLTRLSLLVGNTLADADANVLGTVDDVFLAPDGSAAYLIVNTGSVLVPVPASLVLFNPRTETLVYRSGSPGLAKAPAYGPDVELPVERAPGWDADLVRYWGSDAPAWAEDALALAPLRASFIFTRSLNDPDGNSLGAVADLVLNSAYDQRYLALDTADHITLIPWQQVEWQDGGGLVYTGDPAQLDGSPPFASIRQLHPNIAAWERAVVDYWALDEDGG